MDTLMFIIYSLVVNLLYSDKLKIIKLSHSQFPFFVLKYWQVSCALV